MPIRLTIYDGAGRRVRSVLEGPMAAGDHAVIWDGRDQAGLPAAGGVYQYVLHTPDRSTAHRLTLLR